MSALEFYLPAVLSNVHSLSWKNESLDGVFHHLARRTGPRQVELAGLCLFISDQTLTPYHVQLRVAANVAEIEWLDLRLGESRDGVMVRTPYDPYFSRGGLRTVPERLPSIEWQFHVGFGDPPVEP